MNDLITQMFCTGIVPILFDAHKYVYIHDILYSYQSSYDYSIQKMRLLS